MGEEPDAAESLQGLATEDVDPRFSQIDRLSTSELVALMNQVDAEPVQAISKELPAIASAVDAIVPRLAAGGRLRYVGAGTAGRMAVVDAAECVPTFSVTPETVNAILAGGAEAFTEAVEGAEDDREAGAAAVAAEDIGPGDAVVGVTASGRTPFVLGAVAEARRRGAVTAGLSCNRGARLSDVAEHPIEVNSGSELVAGSTRLKAGTVQKLVLNMISTVAMVRLGRVYRNYMVDMGVRNEKLAVRAARMVAELTAAEPERAREALERSGNQIKTAVLMLERDLDPDAARRRLDDCGGRLGEALAQRQNPS